MSKRAYDKPVLEYCGEMKERTLGGGGSGFDAGAQSKAHSDNGNGNSELHNGKGWQRRK
jgi:hypothetical protein